MSAVHSFQPDLFTGRAATAIPVALPPGRKGVQPSVALTYSSSSRNGHLGVGWSLDLGGIERSTKLGVPRYDATDTYNLLFQGVTSELVQIPDGSFRAKDEGLFLRAEFKGPGSGWELRDKSGTRYFFGQTAPSQQDAAGGQVFRWCLDKVLDVNGNSFTVTYIKDQGQIYPSQIAYTAHEIMPVLAATNRADFVWEARPDVDVGYRTGFAVTTAKRLQTIEAKATDTTLKLVRRYTLAYTQSGRTKRSLLCAVTPIGSDGSTALPATTFSYQDTDTPTYSISSNTDGSSSVAGWNIRKAQQDTGNDNFGPINPYATLPWESPVVVNAGASVNLGCVQASVGANGSITVTGCQDHFFHAWTWVYVSQAKSLTLSYSGGEAGTFVEDQNGLQPFPNNNGSVTISLNAGWSILHLTGYHQHEGYTNPLSTDLMSQVTAMGPSQFIKPQLAGDADGNGITDLISYNGAAGSWTVACSHGCVIGAGEPWLSGFGDSASVPLLGDWNADGKTDVGIYKAGVWRFATAKADLSGFQADAIPPITFGSGTPLTGDFNGDGVVDLGSFNAGSWQIARGSGASFSTAGSFSRSLGSASSKPLTGDFNGDGLTDIGVVDDGTVTVALSDGSTFQTPTAWIAGFSGSDYTTADFNGDGLTDVALYDRPSGQVRYAVSMGAKFDVPAILPITFSRRTADDGLQLGDFNGDGIADPAVFNAITGSAELSSSRASFPDLLATIRNGLGGSTTIRYQPSTQCDNTCPIEKVPKLPFVIPIVNQSTVDNGMGHTLTTTYIYVNGRYNATTHEFDGFAHVELRDPDANVSITEFHQDDNRKGRPFHSELRDADGNVWTKTDQTWSSQDLDPNVRFVRLDQTDSTSCDGDATCRTVRTRLSYDNYGNVTRTDDDGEVGVTGDERSTVSTYAISTSPTVWILNKPNLVQTLDASGAVVTQRRFVYDGAADSSALPTKGQLTKEEEWLNLPAPARWLPTTLTYDAFGNVLTVTDALGRKTTNTYDGAGAVLLKVANALGHTRQFTYHPLFGSVVASIDQNTITTTTEYDALGRVTKVIGPNDTSALPTVHYSYDVSAAPPTKTTACARIQSSGAAELCTDTFADGLGRTIQIRSPAEDPTKQVVSGAFELNARGLVAKQWVSYLDATSVSYRSHTTIPNLAPPVLYSYDPLGRLVSSAEPDGSVTTTSYDDWTITATDANGNRTRRASDAAGRLIKVDELNGPQTFTTTYTYDALGNLLQVTNAQGHLTRIAYDSLGRKRSMDDPDMGHWDYAYDDVDNLTSQTDARGVTVAFTYDALNRVTQKSYTVPAGAGVTGPTMAVTYTYDTYLSRPNLIGKLAKIVDSSGSSEFEYDNLGRLTRESKILDGSTYTIQRTYDLLGRLLTLTYPDTDVVSYTYNDQGGINTVSLQAAGSSSQTLVSNIDYNATGQLTKLMYGNGLTTDYSYDPQTLRLNTLRTTGSTGTLQDFSYAFDRVGNVTAITDRVHTATQSFRYDPLNRLTQASGAYGAVTYDYDALGNLMQKEGATMAYGRADGSKPHAVTSCTLPQGSPMTLSYDANGNLTEKPSPASPFLPQLLSYDVENRLVEARTGQSQTIIVTLKAGWNFFSLPTIPTDNRIPALFPNFATDVEQLVRYEPDGTFRYHVGNAKFDDFGTLDYDRGYQIYCKRNITLTLTGLAPTKGLKPSLPVGWHLLPGVTLQPTTPAAIFGSIDSAFIRSYDTSNRSLTTVTSVQPASAYYVKVRTASTWSPPLPKDVLTTFVYDGDGGRVKQITAAGATKFLGQSYEIGPDGSKRKYVFAGSQRIAAIDTPAGLAQTEPLSRWVAWWERLLDAFALREIPTADRVA